MSVTEDVKIKARFFNYGCHHNDKYLILSRPLDFKVYQVDIVKDDETAISIKQIVNHDKEFDSFVAIKLN